MSTASAQRPNPLPPRRDTRAALATVRWGREVPATLRLLGALEDADYADVVTATLDATPTEPEQVVHAVLDGLPRGLFVLIVFVQRAFLGFRLKLRPSADRLLGWKIAAREESWIRIETSSWFMTAHVVMHVEEGRVSLASFIRYDRRLAAFVWPPVCLVHRQVGLALVRRAIRTL
ncbi:MAG TPA: hypothetical protein VGY13_11515 [Solirubrobacteraceae bacterium]|jgi:hypothetical protein|nr:hypothetical protein [Solirubrobacteraceae bacterium]